MSGTARGLGRRLQLLLGLSAAVTLVLFGAYRGVHDDAVPLAGSSAPGILAVETAEHALGLARQAVPAAGEEGAGTDDFHTQISVAHQSLALAASEDVTGLSGRQTLQTVTGLIAVYSGWVEQANREPAASPLRAAYLHYANQVLDAPGTDEDIVGRLEALRQEQWAVAERQAAFGPPLWLAWGAGLVLLLALCGALVEAQRFVRRCFRQLVNPPLLAATVLWAAGAGALVWLTVQAHRGMAEARDALRAPLAGDDIPGTGEQVEGHMANAGVWAAVADWIPFCGVVLMALAAAGLWPRIAEYRFRGAARRWR